MVKLHLGCGLKKIEGYVNVDIRPEVNPDVIDNIHELSNISNNSVDEIYACHVLEHFGRHEYIGVLQRWYEVLKEGGVLKISVPDFEKVNEYYNETKDLTKLIGFLYGGQTYKENYHYYAWDFNSLKNDLISLKFKDVTRFDWRKTDHSNVDDFSQSYLPHMDKENGKLMSLNIQVIK
jgi:ubiquinone/menaquinone biosynthesis C-methylase UbiE